MFQIREQFDEIDHRISQMGKSIIEDEVPKSVFIDEGTRPEDRLKERITTCSDKSRQIHKFFKKSKSYSKLKGFFHVSELEIKCHADLRKLLMGDALNC